MQSIEIAVSLVKQAIGKKHAFKKYDQFALNTSCFWGSTGSNITPVMQFHEIFVTKIIHYLLSMQKFCEIAQLRSNFFL